MTAGFERPSVLRVVGRWVARLFPFAAVALAVGALARGGFRSFSSVGWGDALVFAVLLAAIAQSGLRRLRRAADPIPLQEELELGAALIAAACLTVAIAGPQLFPLLYLLMAFLVGFLSRPAGLTLLGVALVFNALLTWQLSPWAFAVHSAFLCLFAVAYHLVLSARIAAARRAERDAVAARVREAEERARTFRLVSAGSQESSPGLHEEEKWLLASVTEIDGAVGAALEIAEMALNSHTVAAFLLSADDRTLKLHDCRSVSERVQRERFPAGEGVMGGVLTRRVPVRMASAAGLRGVTYYEPGERPVGALLAVPIMEGTGLVRGVLVADREAPDPFNEADERLLSTVAAQVLRAIEVERVLGYVRKARDEKDQFFKAIEELNRASSPEQVFAAVLESVTQLAQVEFCAITLVEEEGGKRQHRIARMAGVSAQGKAGEGQVFADNHGLVANVVRYGAALPSRDVQAMDRQVVFDPEIQIRGLASLKIFPLLAGGRILGTLVAGSRSKGVLGEDALRMLEVIALQAAQSVLRAQLYAQMERMATTDGLTGLLNHRSFQQRADELLAQAKRYGRKCSLLLTDIDHFKSVNDTYGHPTGDVVLKGVAKILREKARDADLVARYGGEEFAIVMPETDARGAQAIAERIREAVMAEVFQTELGPLKVTLTLGIATCPDHAPEKQQLIDLADQCLYFGKRHGRNRSVTVSQMQGGALKAG